MATASSYIDSSQRIEGTIEASEDLVLAGQFKGELESSHAFVIDPTGVAEATIRARRVEIHGVVVGHIVASEDILVSKTGQVQGSVKARRFQVEPGGRIDADVESGEGTQATRAPRRGAPRRQVKRGPSARREIPREPTRRRPLREVPIEVTPPVADTPIEKKAPKKTPKKTAKKPSKGRTKTRTKPKVDVAPREAEIVEIPESETVEDLA